MLGPSNLIYQLAESSSKLENGNITHNIELWDSDHHMLSLSGNSRHLETDAKILSPYLLSVLYALWKSTFLKENILTNSLLS